MAHRSLPLCFMTIATIDVGTNTALLLVANVHNDGALKVLHEAERFVRLGEGVDATGCITEAAMARLRTALLAYRTQAEDMGASTICIGATSASRDARNKAELIDFVRRETGLSYQILSGEEEAILTFRGAISAFTAGKGPRAVIDIGGGSTEIIVGDEEDVSFRCSLDIGSVRLTERYFMAQPPGPDAIARAEQAVREAIEAADIPLSSSIPLIGAAGTLVALALVHTAMGMQERTRTTVTLSASDIHAWRTRLLRHTRDEVLAIDPAVMEGRADVFPAGVLLLDVVMQHFHCPACRVSPRGLRHGLAIHWAQAKRNDVAGSHVA